MGDGNGVGVEWAMVMEPALRDFMDKFDIPNGIEPVEASKDLFDFLLVKGVKIGGIYRHFKGKEYEVSGVGRDSNNWDNYVVYYFEVCRASHKAVRPLEEFLGDVDKPEYKGPRFILVA